MKKNKELKINSKKVFKKVLLFLPEILIFAFAFLTRFLRLNVPGSYIFDEVYHAFTAEQMLKGNPAAWEWWNTPPKGFAYEWTHPPLAKEFMVIAMSIFGDNPFAWRFFSALFGFGVIVLIYLISYKLFKNRLIALFAAFAASMDGLLLVMSRIAMNDMYFLFFILLAFLLFLHNRKFLMGLALGLSIASKWTGLFGLGIIGLLYVIQLFLQFRNKDINKRIAIKNVLGIPLFFIVLPVLIYLAVYLPFFTGKHTPPGPNQSNQQQSPQQQEQSINQYIVKSGDTLWGIAQSNLGDGNMWRNITGYNGPPMQLPVGITLAIPQPTRTIIESNTPFSTVQSTPAPDNSSPFNINTFIGLQEQMYWYHTRLKATHPYQSIPSQWVFDLRPVWIYVDYKENMVANIYNLGNPLFMWFGLVSIIFLLFEFIRKRTMAIAIVLIGYLGFFLPWVGSPRIMFYYHYMPAVPFLAIATGYVLNKLFGEKFGKIFVGLFLLFLAILFIYFFPLWTAIHMPKCVIPQGCISWYDSYFWFSSWK